MSWIDELLVEGTEWSRLETASGTAEHVPDALKHLAQARTEDEAKAAYWELDNEVVVQGRLYEAAVPVVSVLLAMLQGQLSRVARARVVDLLVEIALGDPPARGDKPDGALGELCRALVREGIWTVYGLLLDEDPAIRQCALLVVANLDTCGRPRVVQEDRHEECRGLSA
jgi:hypothetical protein